MKKIIKYKNALITIAFFLIVTNTVDASILGNPVSESTIKFGEDTYYNKNVFFSEQSGVNKQTENYIVYTPNENVKPAVSMVDAVHGTKKPDAAINYLYSTGKNPLSIINADFFSFQTGVPMSHTIIDGKIISKDIQGQDAIGFNADGSAFISWLEMSTEMSVNGSPYMYIDNINKYRLAYGPYLYTRDYSSTTKASGDGYNVIIGSVSGPMKIGEPVTGVIEEIIETKGAVDIPEGKLVLSIDKAGFADTVQKISALNQGDKISIITNAIYDSDRWKKAVHGVGCIGGRLLDNGQVKELDGAAAPRTAIGIKADGSIIFYTIDGRQNGHSYGVRLLTLAQRLKELGCVDAVNLDGGGSTFIKGVYPGDDSMTLLNIPSDGALRSVSNFIYLSNTQQATGSLEELFIYPYDRYYLSGANELFSVKGVDSAFHKADISGPVEYGISEGSHINNEGWATLIADENNSAVVTAKSGNASGTVKLKVFKDPSGFNILNEADSSVISTLKLNIGHTIHLTADAYLGHQKLVSSDSCYTWSVENSSGEIGVIDPAGSFTASDKSAEGKIIVTAGKVRKEIPVEIIDPSETYNSRNFAKIETGISGNVLTATVTNPRDTSVSRTDISMKADGEEINFNYSGDTITATFPIMPHKVRIEVKNSLGNTTLKSVVVSEYLSTNKFTDTQGHWADNIISYMNSCGVVNGNPTGNGQFEFRPDDNMTRAEFAVMLSNFMGVNKGSYDNVNLPYTDLAEIPPWAINEIKAMYSLGIMKGRADGDLVYFDTRAKINRSEVVASVTRLLPDNIARLNIEVTDKSQIPQWAEDSVQKAFANGIISGYDDNTFRPLANITRAEAVKILYTVL